MPNTRHLARWTDRNEDKPHRCPHCHAIAVRAWLDRGYGPSTVMICCGLKWRVGNRSKRRNMAEQKWINDYRASQKIRVDIGSMTR